MSRENNIEYDLVIPVRGGQVLNIQTDAIDVGDIKDNLNNILKKDLIRICDEFKIDYYKSWSSKKLKESIETFLDNLDNLDNTKYTSNKKNVSDSSNEDDDEKKHSKDSGNSIVSCVNACHNILRNNDSIVGEKAMHDIMRLLFLKFLEPLIVSGTVDILDPPGEKNKGLSKNAKYSEFYRKSESGKEVFTKQIWKLVLAGNPMTSKIFKRDDFWNCSQETLVLLLDKIDKTLKDSKFDELDHDVKGRIYEEFLNGYSNNAGKDFGQYFTTRDYIRLIFGQIPKTQNDWFQKKKGNFSVLDPCMGTAGFLTETYGDFPKAILKGCEIEAETYTYALMNMILTTGTLVPENFSCFDSLVELDPREKFDFIPTNPPYGTKMDYKKLQDKYEKKWAKELNDSDSDSDDSDSEDEEKKRPEKESFPKWDEIFPVKTNDGVALFLQYLAFKLKPGGMAIPIIPNGQLLFGKNFEKLRKYLLTKVDIEQIMYTPGGVFKHAGVKTAVLWMRKPLESEGKPTKKIKFVETTKALDTPTPVAEITREQLAENNWSLDASYYKAQEIPDWNGCEWKPLGEVCEIKNGKNITKKDLKPGNITVVGGGKNPMGKHNSHNIEPNTTIVSKDGNDAGYVSIYNEQVFATNHALYLANYKETILPEYIHYYLVSIQKDLYNLQSGAGQPGIKKDMLEKLKIPVPPMKVQERIVKELDELEKSKEVIRSTIEARKSVLEKFRRHKNPPFSEHKDQIEWKPLGEIMSMKGGSTNSSKAKGKSTGKIPFYAATVSNPSGMIDKYDFDDPEYLLYVKSGGNASTPIGRSLGICKVYFVEGKSSANVAVFQFKLLPGLSDKISLKYLYKYLDSLQEFIQRTFVRYATGNGNTDMDAFKKLKIPVPPMEVQEEFVRFYEAKEAKIQQMEADIADAEAYLADINELGRTIIEDLICS